jgi:DNA mismatch repair protein MSH6
LLRNILPSSTQWVALHDVREFYPAAKTHEILAEHFATADDIDDSKPRLTPEIERYLDVDLVMEAMGGMICHLKSLKLDVDLLSQRNFNIYDPLKEGKGLVLDGQTLGHMEVSRFVNQLELRLTVRYW